MSALDLFAMLNAPLPGSGAGAPASGPSGVETDGAFAGLLAMMAPKGDATGAATAATTAAAGTSLAPFRVNVSGGVLAPSEEAPSDEAGDGGQDAVRPSGHEDGVVLAGLNTAAPAPPPTTPGLAARGAPEGPPAPAPASPPTTTPVSAEGAPTAPSAGAGDGASSPMNGGPPSPEPDGAEAAPGPQAPASAEARPLQASQNAQAPHPQQAAFAPPAAAGGGGDPVRVERAPATPPAPVQPAASADAPAPAEATRAVGRQGATTAVAAEAGRTAHSPRPEPAAAERRMERRAAEGRTSLFAPTESGDASRPTAAAPAPAPANAAVAPTPAPAPGSAGIETRAEAAPVPLDPATPDGEAAPEPVRTTESQSAASVREHLPSTLARAGVETTAMLSAQIVRRLEARSTRFDMVLTPEDLGRVDVRMEVDSDGQLTARLAFDNPAAAAELRGRADELRRQLEAAGFQMSEGSLEFAEREGGRRDHPFDQRERAFSGAGRLAMDADVPAAPPRWTAYSLTPDGVDMKV